MPPALVHAQSPHCQHPHQSGTCVTVDEPVMTHRDHPKSVIPMAVHSWRCTFCGFGQTYNDTSPSVEYRILRGIITALKILCAAPVHLPPEPWQPLIILPSP